MDKRTLLSLGFLAAVAAIFIMSVLRFRAGALEFLIPLILISTGIWVMLGLRIVFKKESKDGK